MYSYPNYIPLPAPAIRGIVDRVMGLNFDRIYSHFTNLEIETDARAAVRRSAERYLKAIGAE